MSETSDFIRDWFRLRHPDKPIDALLDANYFEAGLLDSLGVIELIGVVEERFSFRFDQAHFQDRRFPTILGLAAIVAELRSA